MGREKRSKIKSEKMKSWNQKYVDYKENFKINLLREIVSKQNTTNFQTCATFPAK